MGTINQKRNVSLEKENTQSLDYEHRMCKVSEFTGTCTKQQDTVGEERREEGEAVKCLHSFACKSMMSQEHS